MKIGFYKYPVSRRLLVGALPGFFSRYLDMNPSDAAEGHGFDSFLVDLAVAPKSGARGRIIIRGLKSLRIQYDKGEEKAPFSLWIIENFCTN